MFKWNSCGVGSTITQQILGTFIKLCYDSKDKSDYNFSKPNQIMKHYQKSNLLHDTLLVCIIFSYFFDSNFGVHLSSYHQIEKWSHVQHSKNIKPLCPVLLLLLAILKNKSDDFYVCICRNHNNSLTNNYRSPTIT